MAFAFLSLMKGEPLVWKRAAYPSVVLAYCAYVPEETLSTTAPPAAAAHK